MAILWSIVLSAATAATLRQTLPANPPRDVRSTVQTTAAIAGVVVADDVEARPVRHARVTLSGAEPFVGLTTISDDRGRFVFSGLPAGRFTVSVAKDGWVAAAYGAKRPNRPGTAVPLGDGQTVDVSIRLSRGAVITGEVLDNAGLPAIGTTVRAMRYAIQNGERRLVPNRASATTDDRGVYRIYGLPPGDYVVGASWRPGFFGTQGNDLRLTTDLDVRYAKAQVATPLPRDRTVALASTFYPGTTVPSQASVISIRGPEERSGVDFTLQVVPTATVEGTLGLAGAAMPGGVQVSLMAGGQTMFAGTPFDGYRTVTASADGSFAFSDVAPGQYTVLARAVLPAGSIAGAPQGQPQVVWASTDVSVDGDPISGLSLLLVPGMSVAGEVRFSSASTSAPFDPGAVRVTLQPIQSGDAVTIAPRGAAVDANGHFILTGVTPGRYRLTATYPGAGRAGGWNLRSAVVNGIDTLDTPFIVRPNVDVSNAVITFSDTSAQLRGRLLQQTSGAAAPGYSIVLFPVDRALWIPMSRRIQSVRPAADGAFAVTNVAPGRYYLAALDDVEPGEWYDPEFLQRLVPTSMRIAIAEGEQKIQDIRLGR